MYKLIPSKLPVSSNIQEWELLLPKQKRQKILQSYHDLATAAHLGFFKTFLRIFEKYYWPKIKLDIYTVYTAL